MLLSEILYTRFRDAMGGRWPDAVKALSAAAPGDIQPGDWRRFLSAMKSYNAELKSNGKPEVAAVALAEAVVAAISADAAPTAILSFNAEPLLYALINAVTSERHKPSDPACKSPTRLLDRVTQLLSYREAHRVPYLYCHGLLPFEGASPKFVKATDSGKLVFSEGEYLALANTSFAWQSTTFLSSCLFRTMIFVGVSLSDPNMRRWLAWVFDTRRDEMSRLGKAGASTQHYWLQKDPKSPHLREWIESSVAHLGVRLIWLSNWSEASACISAAAS